MLEINQPGAAKQYSNIRPAETHLLRTGMGYAETRKHSCMVIKQEQVQ